MNEHDRNEALDSSPERMTAFLAQALLITVLALVVHAAATTENTLVWRRVSGEGRAFLSLTLRHDMIPVTLVAALLLDVLLFGLAAAARGAAGSSRRWPTTFDTAAALLILASLWAILLGVVGRVLQGPVPSDILWRTDTLATLLALIPYIIGREILFRRLRRVHERTAASVYLGLAWVCRKEAVFSLATVLTVLAGAAGISAPVTAWLIGFVKLRILGGAVVAFTRTLADEGGFMQTPSQPHDD